MVHRIHAKGARAICYVDVGSWEPYRSDAERARSLQWTIVERLGTHLDIASDEEAIADIQSAGLALLHRKRSPNFNVVRFPEVYNYVFVRS